MNNILQEALSQAKGPLSTAVINEVNCLASGSMKNTWQLKLNTGEKLFAKTTSNKD